MKTKEELNALKDKAKKEAKPEGKGGVMLTDEELEQVTGGGSGVLVYENNSDSSYLKENSEGSYEGDPRKSYGTVTPTRAPVMMIR